jgi:glycosyltransferase involved in cell wall biosynthesis
MLVGDRRERGPVAPGQEPQDGRGPPALVSVILPNYNHGWLLSRSLGALLRQTHLPDEILVVDDGSTDNSVAIIEAHRQRCDRIRLIRHEVNRGAFAAVRSGIAAASGKFLLFAAADDFILPDLIARAVQAFQANPEAAFFCSQVALLDREGRLVGIRPVIPPRYRNGYLSPAEVRREIRHTDNWFIGPSVIYRRNLLAAIGYFDESLGTLCDGLAARLLAFRHGFYFETEVLAIWTVDPSSLSAKSSLSVTESRRVIDAGRRWITARFPADVCDTYRERFDRRLRFNMARHWLVWRHGRIDSEAISELLGWGRFDRALSRQLAIIPRVGPFLLLALMTIRLRPFGFTALLTSGWHAHVVERRRRALLARQLLAAGRYAVQSHEAIAYTSTEAGSPS